MTEVNTNRQRTKADTERRDGGGGRAFEKTGDKEM